MLKNFKYTSVDRRQSKMKGTSTDDEKVEITGLERVYRKKYYVDMGTKVVIDRMHVETS